MLHKHPEPTAKVVSIAIRGQPLQAIDAQGTNQQNPMVNRVSAVSFQQQPKQQETCRTKIDSRSQLNLMSRRMADRLALSTTRALLSIHGIGNQDLGSSSRAHVLLSSLTLNFQMEIEVFILPQLMKNQSSVSNLIFRAS